MNNKFFAVILIFLSSNSTVAMATDTVTRFKCGNVSVIFYNSDVVESPFFVLTVETPGNANFHTFPVTSEFLDIRCEKSNNGKDFLLVNHICGGTACAETNFGLIDIYTGKDVLEPTEPNRGNKGKAESILEKQIKPFGCTGKRSKGSFPPNEQGEYCFMSPIELY